MAEQVAEQEQIAAIHRRYQHVYGDRYVGMTRDGRPIVWVETTIPQVKRREP